MQSNVVEVLRRTESLCPKCLKKIKADIITKNNRVYMLKECAEHGSFEVLLSNHSWYYKGLTEFFFSLIKADFTQKDYLLYLTDRCNLNCPICLNGVKDNPTKDFKLEKLKGIIKGKKGLKFNLMGAEPTMREDLPDVIRMIKSSGNRVSLHTNGIKLADIGYLKELAKAGLREVNLQFDGFDDQVYMKLRGRKLLDIKLQVLDNLRKIRMATHIKATIAKGVNEQEMAKIFKFGVENDFINEIGFIGLRFLGNARNLPYEMCLVPDELIDILEKETKGKISRKAMFNFQKMYYFMLDVFSVRKCCYNQHFLISRDKMNYIPIDKSIDIDGIAKKLDKFNRLKQTNKTWALLYAFLSIAPKFFTVKGVLFLKDFLFFKIPLVNKFDLSKFPRGKVIVSFTTICDSYTIDYQIARHCCFGEISDDFGIQDPAILNFVRRQGQVKVLANN